MRLHLEQDNLNDKRLHSDTQQLRRHGVEMCSWKEGRGTRHRGQNLQDIVESIRVRHEGSQSDDEIGKEEAKGRCIN